MYVSVFPPPGTALDKDRHNHRPVCSTDTINVTNISFWYSNIILYGNGIFIVQMILIYLNIKK